MHKEDKHRKLKNYLGYHLNEYNGYFLNPERNEEEYEKIAFEINQSLDEAMSYNNSIVHHCGFIGGLTVEILSIWFRKRIGKFVKFPNYLSTTKDADHFFKNQPKVFQIITANNSNGKDVSSLGFELPQEGEITFKKDSVFQITNVESNLITLTEHEEAPDDVIILYKDYFLEDQEIREIIEKENQHNNGIKSLTDQGLI